MMSLMHHKTEKELKLNYLLNIYYSSGFDMISLCWLPGRIIQVQSYLCPELLIIVDRLNLQMFNCSSSTDDKTKQGCLLLEVRNLAQRFCFKLISSTWDNDALSHRQRGPNTCLMGNVNILNFLWGNNFYISGRL